MNLPSGSGWPGAPNLSPAARLLTMLPASIVFLSKGVGPSTRCCSAPRAHERNEGLKREQPPWSTPHVKLDVVAPRRV